MRIVLLLLFVLFHKGFSSEYDSRISSSMPLKISKRRPILSPKSIFKLGFFTPAVVGDRWYLGIWNRRFPSEVVWVANRNNPLPKPIGTLTIFKNNLDLVDQYGKSVWSTSTNGTSQRLNKSVLTGELLDNGNLVLRCSDKHDSSEFLWQSFDDPTDTLLPDMKVGWDKKSGLNKILRSWKTTDDPSTCDYTYKVEILRSEEISYSFSISNASFFSILRLSSNGALNRSTWIPRSGKFKRIDYLLPNDACDVYNTCGPNGLCDINTSPPCNCIHGFQPREQEAWELQDRESGCVPKTQSRCSGDQFLTLKNMKLPDTAESVVDMKLGLKECEKKCLNNCNCTAYANESMKNGGSGCIIWVGELLDVRKNKVAGQNLYVKMDAIYIGELHFESMELETIVQATQGFSDSNKIGKGGFGIVYKGRLLDGQEIAVKRLSKISTQGIAGFKTELSLIASVQHVNLVQLLGYCFEGGEMIIIYEYLENSSLDTFIFDESQSSKLNWEKRFQIINGITRGLLYLHQDSRYPIVHRDLKPRNVLLDKDMVPKISDFGMGNVFDKNKAEANTTNIVGTYGYMSPEYAEDGTYSTKSDVFSFGVLVLEIIYGKTNRESYKYSENEESLINYIWRYWKEGKGLDIIDPVIFDSSTFQPHEVKRCIQIGLLCVQERPEDRPTVLSVSVMLASDTMEIALPKPPGYSVRRSPLEIGSSSRKRRNEESWTVTEVTYSGIEPR
ncbi:PREDICTED: receptor-like serine/threonine-protein kinase SD1-8 [Camelina sativa]|uniref:Receptor-like serine/threonine-protein kinase n=1 Tax=Camelina sativa TaxID=90675 RepID=A0ABM1QL56_CAMSA|nr:PREDICTED: receptor-like serine/threonine-protein kinase SD1-8 [Camelina sativa]